MATNYGYRGDVNNSISLASAYPGGRSYGQTQPSGTRYMNRNNSAGEVASVNQDAKSNASVNTGIMGKPSSWWLMFAVVFIGFVFLSRKYSGGDTSFSNVKLTVYNGLFLTFFIVLMLNMLKVFATKFKIPGVSDLILAA